MANHFDLLHAIDSPILLFDSRTLQIVFINQYSQQLFYPVSKQTWPIDEKQVKENRALRSIHSAVLNQSERKEKKSTFRLEIKEKRRLLYDFKINHDEDNHVFVAHGQDVTELEKSQQLLHSSSHMLEKYSQEMYTLAHVDQLTSIANRRALFSKYQQLKQTSPNIHCAVAIIDIDHFKHCNDTYGHSFGDEILKSLTQHIKEMLPETSMLARLGGEEFCILHSNDSAELLTEIVNEILVSVKALSLTTPKNTITNISFSAGVSDCLGSHEPLDELLRKADKALYYAKQNGRSRVTRYSANLLKQ
ncbi:GGDEF domain-containing protein [Vibrio amylolyticus]|uniref:GGDEF domain-containing protein n=1 Tax=Vibrio amylolyticus TaxID=2847292 RepID=UPI00354C12CB